MARKVNGSKSRRVGKKSASKQESSSAVDHVQVVEQYRVLQPKYEKLATEVEYIIRDALREESIPTVSLSVAVHGPM